MKKISLCSLMVILMLLGASVAGAALIDLTPGRGTQVVYDGAIFREFDVADQTTVSSGTGVIDPFLTIQRKGWEESFNSDFFPVLDATRPAWNHSIQISDLVEFNSGYYEFLLDLNEPSGNKSFLTQHELEVYLVNPTVGGSISTKAGLEASGLLIWDLDRLEDSTIEYDYDWWSGSGQNIDASFQLETSLFDGFSADTYVYLYAQFGQIQGDGSASEDGFEEYALREGGESVPEPTTIILLCTGLLGLTVMSRKRFKK